MQSVFAYHVTFWRKMRNKILPFKGILSVMVTNNFIAFCIKESEFYYYILIIFNLKSKASYSSIFFKTLELFHPIHHLGIECRV